MTLTSTSCVASYLDGTLLHFCLAPSFFPSPLCRPQIHPLFILSVSDFILAILWMIGGIVWLNPGEKGWATEGSDPHTGMCYVLAVATTVSSSNSTTVKPPIMDPPT